MSSSKSSVGSNQSSSASSGHAEKKESLSLKAYKEKKEKELAAHQQQRPSHSTITKEHPTGTGHSNNDKPSHLSQHVKVERPSPVDKPSPRPQPPPPDKPQASIPQPKPTHQQINNERQKQNDERNRQRNKPQGNLWSEAQKNKIAPVLDSSSHSMKEASQAFFDSLMPQKTTASSFNHNSDHSLESNHKIGWDANAFSNESDDSQDIRKDIVQNIKMEMEFSDNDSNPSGGQPFSLSSLPPLVSPENDSKSNLKLQNSSSSRGFMSIFSSDAGHGNDDPAPTQTQPKVDTFNSSNKAVVAINHNESNVESLLIAAKAPELTTDTVAETSSSHKPHKSKKEKHKHREHKEDKHREHKKEHKSHKHKKDKEKDKERKRRDKEDGSSDSSKIKVEQQEGGSLKLKISRNRSPPPLSTDGNDIANQPLKLKIAKERLSVGTPTTADVRNQKRKLSSSDENSSRSSKKPSFGGLSSESLLKSQAD